MTLRVSALTRRLAAYVGTTCAEIGGQIFRDCTPAAESSVGVLADPSGDWIETLLTENLSFRVHHLATSPGEQLAAQERARTLGRYDSVMWDALKLPSQPNPSGCHFDLLICGLHGGRLCLPELFDWARQAVIPGGRFALTLETYCGRVEWERRFTHYRRFRSRYLDRAPELDEQAFPTRDALIVRLQEAGFKRILLRGLHRPRPFAWTEFIVVTAR